MIELKQVTKIYKSKKSSPTVALNNINLKIGNKGMIFIVGKSGSGKSTLLNLLGGLDNPTNGELLINDKNISNFTKNQYDSYRNTYIGFIFQEFNVLEQYNVYENIELALKLQNQEVDKSSVDELLNNLGLNNLGKRKINELSGGQKQRVAIARALIKKPQIILADEPTGNLDKNSSEQIFNILKEISKNQLVIVVSHDMESALKYADRIIQIEDGKIVSDSNSINKIENEKFELKKSKLPLSYALKMAVTSFKTKPFKLIMTVIITAFSLIFMGITVNFALFDKIMLITNTMEDNNNYVYDVYHSEFSKLEGTTTPLELSNNDLEYIKNLTNSKLNIVYNLYSNNEVLSFEFDENNIESEFYQHIGQPKFIEVNDNRIYGNIIGRYIENYNEIIVHKYFADYIIKFGIMTTDNKLYFPKDYNDLVTSNKKIKLGKNSVVIVGIVDDDDSLFLDAKKSLNFTSDELRMYFQDIYVEKGSTIYTKGFVDNAILESNKESILDYIYIINKSVLGQDSYTTNNIYALNKEVSFVTKNGITTTNSLEKDEVIISINSLREADSNFDSKFIEYLSSHNNTIYDEALKDFIVLYLNDNNNVITTNLSFHLPNNHNNYKVNIIGISLNENSYISNKYVEEYNPILKRVSFVKIYDNNINNLKRVFKKLVFSDHFNESGTYYNYTLDNADDISSVIYIYKYLTIYILIITLVFILFTFLLFSNFISVSISYCKKEIGILRALGATNRDIIKIFGYESIIIGVISWGLSIIGWIITCNILNNSIFGSMYFTLNGIILHPFVPIIMFIYTIAIALFITVVSINRITKIRPIDAILNK